MFNQILPFFFLLSLGRKIDANFDFLLPVESDEELLRTRRLALDDDAWDKKVELWSKWIHRLVDTYNVSIIGWQNIYDNDGSILEVDTIELTFPVKPGSKSQNFLKDGDVHRSDQHRGIKVLKTFQPLTASDTVDVFVEDFRHGEDPISFYWNPTTTYFRPDALVTFNKTQIATEGEIQAFLEKLNQTYLGPVVLKYDVDGNLKSKVDDIQDLTALSYVVDSWEASDVVLHLGPAILADVAISHRVEEIPQELARRFNARFDNFDWRVLVNPGDLHVDQNVWIKLSTDGFEFYEGEKEVYYVYGVKKFL